MPLEALKPMNRNMKSNINNLALPKNMSNPIATPKPLFRTSDATRELLKEEEAKLDKIEADIKKAQKEYRDEKRYHEQKETNRTIALTGITLALTAAINPLSKIIENSTANNIGGEIILGILIAITIVCIVGMAVGVVILATIMYNNYLKQ